MSAVQKQMCQRALYALGTQQSCRNTFSVFIFHNVYIPITCDTQNGFSAKYEHTLRTHYKRVRMSGLDVLEYYDFIFAFFCACREV